MFCRRQWALIHIEQQWEENYRTVDGELMHKNAHDDTFFEKRGSTLIVRDLSLSSKTLGVSGKSDVVEFHQSENGITLNGQEGLWQPYPVEYKRGEPKEDNCDAAQLCAQAMCLEEMLCCQIDEGALFYGKSRRRQVVKFSNELREEVSKAAKEMHLLYQQGYTPKVKKKKSCASCSLKDICLPQLEKVTNVDKYIKQHLLVEDS